VLISGRGSNLAALIAAARAPDYPAEIALVIANRADAGGLALARDAGIAAAVVPHRDYASREDFDAAVERRLIAAGCELVCLAGFMRIFSAGFVARWRERVLNIHPALLPAFPGLHVHRRTLEAGVRIAGCTVHFVTEGVDEGPIIVQAAVPVLPDDDEAALAARILAAEHRAYPRALALVASGRARVDGTRVAISGAPPVEGLLINPE
jgi:formyltetrahydrofolate-dependent phosphoribosylglycinamide formyltransferase